MINVAVIFGGESCEHDISVITGVQLLGRANMSDYNVIPIYIARDGKWYTGDELFDLDNYNEDFKKLKECVLTPSSSTLFFVKKNKLKPYINIDAVIMCLHGGDGEGGGISGLCSLAKIPYSACNLSASAMCLDKVAFKYMMQGIGVKTIEGFSVFESEYILGKDGVRDSVKKLGYPVIIKPARLGSSIGIVVVAEEGELESKLENAFRYDKKVLIEKYVSIEKEINIAIVEDKGDLIFSNTEEPISNSEILSFEEKYKNNPGGFETIKRISPANISDKILVKIKDIATKIYSQLDLFGVVRFDFILDKKNNLYINEVNTIPGSMANYLFDKELYPYTKLIEVLISNAINRRVKEQSYTQDYNSDVLKSGIKVLEK